MKVSSKALEKNQPKVFHAWALFDSANSAHALVITSAIFPAYYLQVTETSIKMGSIWLANETLYAFILSLAYLVVVLIMPLLSGIADYGGRRMWFMKLFTYLGGTACISLYFFTGMESLWIGLSAFMLSLIGFAGCLVFYNSYLPIIATRNKFDRLSARGFSYGYFGSVLLLIGNLWTITYPESIGLTSAADASRWSFVSVGVWWMLLAQIPFALLPPDRRHKFPKRAIKMGYLKIRKVWHTLSSGRNTKRFLSAFFLYSVGVQTIILLAATFAESVMEFETSELILLILLIQIVAIVGAYLFALISEAKGNKFSLLIQISFWVVICIAAFFIETKISFYIVAGFVGLVLGGIQSLSRSSYAKLIDGRSGESTSYFSFYDVLEKISIVLGTFCFGAIVEITGTIRFSVLFLSLFFIAGFLLLRRVRFPAEQNDYSINS